MNFKGISVYNSKWRVKMWDGDQMQHIGMFNTLGEAIGARDTVLKLLSDDSVTRYDELKERKDIADLIDRYGLEKLLGTPLSKLVEKQENPLDFLNIQTRKTEEQFSLEQVRRSAGNVTIYEKEVNRMLVFGDIHVPYEHVDAIDFLATIADVYNPDLIVNLGDEIDNHALSFYPTNPTLPNASLELKYAREKLMEIDRRVVAGRPIRSVESNHTSRMYRKATQSGIPKDLLLPLEDALGVNWNWSKDLVVPLSSGSCVYVTHNKGSNTRTLGQSVGMNVIVGHHHTRGGVDNWTNALNKSYWAVDCPCLIDYDSVAYSYDETNMIRPVLGCTMVISGIPFVILMRVDENNRWIGRLDHNEKIIRAARG